MLGFAPLSSAPISALPAAGGGTSATLTPGAGALSLTGLAPGVGAGATAAPGAGALTVAGAPPTVQAGAVAAPGAGALAWTGFAPSVQTGGGAASVTLLPGVGGLTIAGFAPDVPSGVKPGGGYKRRKAPDQPYRYENTLRRPAPATKPLPIAARAPRWTVEDEDDVILLLAS